MTSPPVPASYQKVAGDHFGYAIPATWREDFDAETAFFPPDASDTGKNGRVYSAPGSRLVALYYNFSEPISALDRLPSIVGLAVGSHYRVVSNTATNVPGALGAGRYDLDDEGRQSLVVHAWLRDGLELYLIITGPDRQLIAYTVVARE